MTSDLSPLLIEVTCHSSERNTTHPYYYDGHRYIYAWTDLGQGDDLDKTFLGDTFTCPASGVYFIGMEAWLRSARPYNYTLLGSPLPFGLSQTVTDRRPSEQYRHAIAPLHRGTRLQINISEAGGAGDSDCFCSWDMFSLSAAMKSLVVFSASRAAPWILPDVINYPDVHINLGGAFSPADNAFKAPQEGVYFFAFSTGLYERFKGHLVLKRNSDVIADLIRTTVSHDGYDMMSCATLLPLKAGDMVTIQLRSGLLYSDPVFRQLAFLGFLYDPYSYQRAWSLELNPVPLDSTSRLPYDVIIVNQGGMYNATSQEVNITTSGYYYIHVTVRRPSRYTSVAVFWRPLEGEETKWPLNAVSAGGAGVFTSATGTVWDLKQGDALWVQVGSGRTRGDLHSLFIGFRIYNKD